MDHVKGAVAGVQQTKEGPGGWRQSQQHDPPPQAGCMRAGLGFNLCGSRETALLPGINEVACEAAQSSSAASILLHAQSKLEH